jgi:hypothetical protein
VENPRVAFTICLPLLLFSLLSAKLK